MPAYLSFMRYILNRSFSTFVATINSMQLDELYAKALNFDC